MLIESQTGRETFPKKSKTFSLHVKFESLQFATFFSVQDLFKIFISRPNLSSFFSLQEFDFKAI